MIYDMATLGAWSGIRRAYNMQKGLWERYEILEASSKIVY